MRLFVAIFPPPDLQAQIAQQAKRGALELPPARWVPEEQIHLTLLFLGEVAVETESIEATLKAVAASREPFQLRVTTPGFFPSRGKARVLWVGLEANRALEELAMGVESACREQVKLDRSREVFRPHLTVGRCRKPWSRGAAGRWTSMRWPDPGGFEVPYFDLVESRLGPSGATYRVLERFELKG